MNHANGSAKLTEDFQGRGYSTAFVFSDFENGIKNLRENGYDMISLSRTATVRMEGKAVESLALGHWVMETVLGLTQKRRTEYSLVPFSPLIQNRSKDSASDLIARCLEEGIQIPGRECYNIPTESFGDNPITRFLFKDKAEEYGLFLKNEHKKDKIPIWMTRPNIPTEDDIIKVGDVPYSIRQIYHRSLDSDAGIYTGYMSLKDPGRVRGLKIS